MKIFKTALFGTMFLIGLTAMPNMNASEKGQAEEAAVKEVPCSSVFTVCDNAHPDSFDDFDSCMSSNGC